MSSDIRGRLGENKPTTILVLGSGLGEIINNKNFRIITRISYNELLDYPKPAFSVPGHAGELIIGELEGEIVAVLSGRLHLYQGLSPEKVVRLIRALLLLGGIKNVIITNAAGGMYMGAKEGDIMLIEDQINNTGEHFTPSEGLEELGLGPVFFDMSDAYTKALHPLVMKIAADQGTPLKKGVYVGNHGPEYETPAEIKMMMKVIYRVFGGWLFWAFFQAFLFVINPLRGAAGMSTVMEVMAVNQYNAGLKKLNESIKEEDKKHKLIRVIGLSYITNPAAGIVPDISLNHDDVKKAAGDKENSNRFIRFVTGIVRELKEAA